MTTSRIQLLAVTLAITLVACGDAPFASIGDRSSGWINEPEVTTTTRPEVEAPRFADSETLEWLNDGIVTESLATPEDHDAIIAEVFGRREGDRFVQASRFEIAAVLPGIEFPARVPHSATWVSSQLVLESNGRLSAEPAVAFGLWSATPYTRSRSVAQMAVLRVSTDPVTADEMSQPDAVLSCGRFAESETDECVLLNVDGRSMWRLTSAGGTTLLWFSGEYRYELFGRTFIPTDVLEEVAASVVPLFDLVYPSEDVSD